MNLILFEAAELGIPLSIADARARHILEVLRRREGDNFDAGVVDGPRGKARLAAVSKDSIQLEFTPLVEPPPLPPLRLIVGLPRPQTARKILNEATTLGVAGIDFVRSDRGEPGYAQSTLWSSGEWRRHLLEGAQQAFCTRLPAISWNESLDTMIEKLPALETSARVALDNYESPGPFSAMELQAPAAVLALGSERGWTQRERGLLKNAGFRFAHLGARVLRVETAVISASTLALVKLGAL